MSLLLLFKTIQEPRAAVIVKRKESSKFGGVQGIRSFRSYMVAGRKNVNLSVKFRGR